MMPEMQNPPMHEHHNTAESARPRPISTPSALQITLPSSVTQPSSMSASRIRNSHLGLDTFSPVNQNGSFEFDRVLKSGVVSKRTRKTKAWKSIYLVLRPNSLSIYKDSKEDKLRHKILLQDLTAVAFLKDPKQKRQNVFGLFSPSRNYHLEATSRKDAEEWVELIRTEARIEQEEEEMLLASPGGNATGTYAGFERTMQQKHEQQLLHDERLGSSSPEPSDPIIPIPRTRRSEALGSTAPRRISQTMEYSGNEVSDMSDTDVARQRGESTVSITDDTMAVKPPPSRPMLAARNVSQLSGFNMETSSDPERVVWQGYLMYLKSVRGVRQWKDYWAVVRPRNIALYKNDSEYSPILIIQLSNIINAVEVDPLSKTKRHCLQVITEEKSYKFCAHGEESLDTSLGALKSLLARRKEGEGKGRGVGGVVGRS